MYLYSYMGMYACTENFLTAVILELIYLDMNMKKIG